MAKLTGIIFYVFTNPRARFRKEEPEILRIYAESEEQAVSRWQNWFPNYDYSQEYLLETNESL